MTPPCIVCGSSFSRKATASRHPPWCRGCFRRIRALARRARVSVRTVQRALRGERVERLDALRAAAERFDYPVAWPELPPVSQRAAVQDADCPECGAPLPLSHSRDLVQRKRSCPCGWRAPRTAESLAKLRASMRAAWKRPEYKSRREASRLATLRAKRGPVDPPHKTGNRSSGPSGVDSEPRVPAGNFSQGDQGSP